jgi:hypothetical protein
VSIWQIVRQIRWLLRARLWAGTGAKVFSPESVIVSAAPKESVVMDRIPPWAIICPAGGESDSDEPQLFKRTMVVRLGTLAMDVLGEASLIGANRVDQTYSEGRGLLEIEEELMAAIAEVNLNEGVNILWRPSGLPTGELDGNERYVSWGVYTFDCYCAAQRYYRPPQDLAFTNLTGGQCRLDWRVPAPRYDRYAQVLRRAAGSTPPPTVTDGVGVAVGAIVNTLTDNPGAGTWSYSLFMGYDETHDTPANFERYSDPATVTGAVT